jgi:hypothetical protein
MVRVHSAAVSVHAHGDPTEPDREKELTVAYGHVNGHHERFSVFAGSWCPAFATSAAAGRLGVLVVRIVPAGDYMVPTSAGFFSSFFSSAGASLKTPSTGSASSLPPNTGLGGL